MKHQWHKMLSTILPVTLLTGWLLCPAVYADVFLSPKALSEKIKNHIQSLVELPDPEASLEVEVLSIPTEALHLKGENLEILFEENQTAPSSSRTIVQLTLSTEAETRRIGVPVRLMVDKPVWVARQMIRAKEPLTLKNVMQQTKRLDYGHDNTLKAQDNILQYYSRMNISAGTILNANNVSLAPAVHANDEVKLIMALASGVNITLLGTAMETGPVGKKIRVKQELANRKVRILNAEVVGKDLVMVRL